MVVKQPNEKAGAAEGIVVEGHDAGVWGGPSHDVAVSPRPESAATPARPPGALDSPNAADAVVRSHWPMRSSLDHLPERKRQQLAQITSIYRQAEGLEMLILFGSHARGTWVEDVRTGYKSDYDLLAVVADAATANKDAYWSTFERQARERTKPVLVHTIVHDVSDVNKQIREGHYFFGDIVKEGVMLIDTGRYRLSKPIDLSPERRLQIARDNVRFWFRSATMFWKGMNFYAFLGDRRHAMFLLHQAAERAYHAVLLVFTAYKPRTHDLVDLATKTESLHPRLMEAFPRTTPADEELLKLLNRAYIDSRYAIDYDVAPEQLTVLRQRVHGLFQRVVEASRDRLDELSGGHGAGELPNVPRFEDMEDLPKMPENSDPASMAEWAEEFVAAGMARMERREEEIRQQALAQAERQQEATRKEALAEGEARGRQQAMARAVAEVLERRGVLLSEAERARILSCRDEAELARLNAEAWRVMAAAELWADG